MNTVIFSTVSFIEPGGVLPNVAGLFRFSAAPRGYEWFLSCLKYSKDLSQFLSEKVYGLFTLGLIIDGIIIKTKLKTLLKLCLRHLFQRCSHAPGRGQGDTPNSLVSFFIIDCIIYYDIKCTI